MHSFKKNHNYYQNSKTREFSTIHECTINWEIIHCGLTVHACTMDQETINCGLAQLLRYILRKQCRNHSCVFSQQLQLKAWPSQPQAAGSGFGSRTQRCWVWLTIQTRSTSKMCQFPARPNIHCIVYGERCLCCL